MEDINNLSYLRVTETSVRSANSLGISVPSQIASRNGGSDRVDSVLGLPLLNAEEIG